MTKSITVPNDTPHIAQLIDEQTQRIMPMPPVTVFDWPQAGCSTVYFDEGSYLKDLRNYLDEIEYGHTSDEYVQWKPTLFDGFFTNGSVLFVPAHVQMNEPVVLSLHSKISCAVNKVIIIAQENSRVNIIYDQNEDADTCLLTTIHIVAEKDAHVTLTVNNTGALWSALYLTSHLKTSGAHVTINGLAALDDSQQCSITTQAFHYAPNTTSLVHVKSLCSDTSKFLFQGLIDVEQTAHNTQASQQNKNILWSTHASAHSIPSLQVRANEVKCAHGSATGPVDEEQLVYLQSRGLDYSNALQLLLESFVGDVLQQVPQVTKDALLKRSMYKVCKV